jgi:tRNA(Ile2) C34 agmatinyltransferase TiaS
MTRTEILRDFLVQQEWEKTEAEAAKKAIEESLPLCPDCGYRGEPEKMYGKFCPQCGTQMQTGTVYEDPEFEKVLKRLGIRREDIK